MSKIYGYILVTITGKYLMAVLPFCCPSRT